MDSTYTLLSLQLLLLHHHASASNTTYLLPIIKDADRLQYYTTFQVGTPLIRVHVSIDLGNPYSWFSADLVGYNHSSSYTSVTVNSTDCIAFSGTQAAWYECVDAPSPICNHRQCAGFASNPLRSEGYLDPLVKDVLKPLYYYPSTSRLSGLRKTVFSGFPFAVQTGSTGPLKGLSRFSKGVLSLARAPIGFHWQVAAAFKVANKFALCLPSSSSSSPFSGVNGAVYFGGGPYFLPPSAVDLSSYLVSTPMVANAHSFLQHYDVGDPSIQYYIKLRSIKIDATPLRFNSSLLILDSRGDGGAKISTMTPYTTLHADILRPFVALFLLKSKALNITSVKPVGPFGACFDSKTVRYNPKTGKGVPVVDLVVEGRSPVLKGKNARWRFYGGSSVVRVSREVSCLAVVEAAEKAVVGVMPAVVVGGKQMEDSLVEFDLEKKRIGVVSELSRFGTSCSQIRGIP